MSQDFTIQQGTSLSLPFYWYSGAPVVKAITAITLTLPPVFTAAGHSMPTAEIPVELVGIRGPSRLNTSYADATRLGTIESAKVYALKVSTDTFSVPEMNASGLAAYTSGGYVRYVPPTDITGYSARMQIRLRPESTTSLIELTSGNSRLVVGTTDGKITASLSATETAALSFDSAVYDLELINGAVVTRIAGGVVTLIKEVTR